MCADLFTIHPHLGKIIHCAKMHDHCLILDLLRTQLEGALIPTSAAGVMQPIMRLPWRRHTHRAISLEGLEGDLVCLVQLKLPWSV